MEYLVYIIINLPVMLLSFIILFLLLMLFIIYKIYWFGDWKKSIIKLILRIVFILILLIYISGYTGIIWQNVFNKGIFDLKFHLLILIIFNTSSQYLICVFLGMRIKRIFVKE